MKLCFYIMGVRVRIRGLFIILHTPQSSHRTPNCKVPPFRKREPVFGFFPNVSRNQYAKWLDHSKNAKDDKLMETTEILNNVQNSQGLASHLFPNEQWVPTETNIWVAQSRLIEEYREPEKWKREMSQVRILIGRGSVAYFLPELEIKGEKGKKYADLVLDGEVLEMKTVSGTRATLGTQFKYGYKQGSLLTKNCALTKEHSVFIWLMSDISVGSVKAKIAGELKNRPDRGRFICYFETSGELHSWTYEELRAIIGLK